MHIHRIQLKNFRCFPQHDLHIESPLVLISGPNGSGKTSLLEALHYACYLRSFRSTSPRELVAFERDNFFIKINVVDSFAQDFGHEVHVGFTDKKKLVKVDQRPIHSYKELTEYYRVITITEDDLALIKGGPEIRRTFIDQALSLQDPDFMQKIRHYNHILKNRNALLHSSTHDADSFDIWTRQLWKHSHIIQTLRQHMLSNLAKRINILFEHYFGADVMVEIYYETKKGACHDSVDEFLQENPRLYDQEKIMGRSLFGAHLDDISIMFKEKKSKAFASRGQQKLIMMLLKIAQLEEFTQKRGPMLMLIDDFMTDFDRQVGEILLELLTNLSIQLIFTAPAQPGYFGQKLLEKGAQHHVLTH